MSRRRRYSRISRKAAAGLSLVEALAAHLGESVEATVKAAVQPANAPRDARRRFTTAQRGVVFTRDGGTCFYCGCALPPSGWDCDHVVPWTRGGRTAVENGVAACSACNRSKGARVN